jgi:acetyl-CoA synthetase
MNRATTLMFEGIPSYPDASRFWQVIEKHQVNIFYTAPTAIRALMRDGEDFVEAHLAMRACACSVRSASRSIRKPGSGITMWSATARCPIVDTWWQTETGGILISPLPGATGRHRRQPDHPRFMAGPDAHGLR